MSFKFILEKQKEGGYTVYAPSLPGCISQGETKKEAIKNIKEAIQLYLDDPIIQLSLSLDDIKHGRISKFNLKPRK